MHGREHLAAPTILSSLDGAVARALAREGAKVFLAGRTLTKLDHVAREISASGGRAETVEVDALNERAIDTHADAVVAKAGGIDIALNAVESMPFQNETFDNALAVNSMQVWPNAIAELRETRRVLGKPILFTMYGQPICQLVP